MNSFDDEPRNIEENEMYTPQEYAQISKSEMMKIV